MSYTHGFMENIYFWKLRKKEKKKTGSGLRGGDMSVAPSYDPNLLQVTFEKPNGPIG